MAGSWEFLANVRGATGNAGDPLSPEAIAAAEAVAEEAVDAVNPVRRTDPLAPVAAAPSDEYLEAVTDLAGRVSEGTFMDGTKHLPHLRTDLLRLGIESVLESVAPVGFAHVEVDASGRISWGVKDDGTFYASNLEVGNVFTRGGVKQSKTVYVVPILGQSNALWKWHDAATVKVREASSQLLLWNAGAGTTIPVPLTHGESIGLNFCQEFARQNPDAVVVAVPTAVGSSGFTPGANGTWDPDSVATPNLYANAVAQTKAALSATGGTLLAVLWSQGENDRATMTQTQYAAALDYMVGKFRADVGVADLVFILGSMTPEEIAAGGPGSSTEGIALAHVDTPRRLLRTSYVWGPKDYGLYGERIHYSFEGNAVRGKIMATEGLYRARLNVTGKNPIAPHGVRIERSGTTAVVSWEAPPCRFTDFNLETSTDYGATWTPAALVGRVALSHSLTGLTATAPLWARLSTTNETGASAKTIEVKA
ncbi:sialate O-acetylesterase [Paenarthrobacter sp. YAF11_1]|uniref:fibronectin type III domain-containing protein n=1 Tax=Paenarthrobacter sp. YAF11_1 TaxID=3233074 RepID=UPI003F9AD2B6